MKETLAFCIETVKKSMEKANCAEPDILVSIQPRGFIPVVAAQILGIPKTVTTYETLGHMGGVGLMVNLHKAKQELTKSSGATVAMYAQGTGFILAAAILEVVTGIPPSRL